MIETYNHLFLYLYTEHSVHFSVLLENLIKVSGLFITLVSKVAKAYYEFNILSLNFLFLTILYTTHT